MQAFAQHRGKVMPFDWSNIDTDAILPKQYMKSIDRTGFGPFLFDGLRYLDPGALGLDNSKRRPNPDFVMNDPRYQHCSILLARKNFGCGSSREHAVWAIGQYGFKVLIASSFADIFMANCLKNGILAITLNDVHIDQLFDATRTTPGYELEVDLSRQSIRTGTGELIHFDIDAYRKHALMQGLDEIRLTLQQADSIRVFEARRMAARPWLFKANP